jgi:chemosensory pili system protein ChpC
MAAEDLYSVLVTINADTLLVPNIAVAEVVSGDGLEASDAGPDWLEGFIQWNGRRVPVVRFETLNSGLADFERSRRARIVVMRAASSRLASGVFGVLSIGYPHLVALTREAISNAPLRSDDRRDLVAARAHLKSQEVAIPNFENLEMEIAEVIAALA